MALFHPFICHLSLTSPRHNLNGMLDLPWFSSNHLNYLESGCLQKGLISLRGRSMALLHSFRTRIISKFQAASALAPWYWQTFSLLIFIFSPCCSLKSGEFNVFVNVVCFINSKAFYHCECFTLYSIQLFINYFVPICCAALHDPSDVVCT